MRGYASKAQVNYIMDLYMDRPITDEEMTDLLTEVHDGPYDMSDMPNPKKAATYLSRDEASTVIDSLKTWGK